MRARLIAVLAMAAGLAGCADNNASVQIYGICAFNDTCSFEGSCDAFLGQDPWVDLAVTNHLELVAEMRNQLDDNSDASTGRTNTNDAWLETIEVSYDGVSAPATSIPVTGTIPAGGSATQVLYAVPPPAVGPADGYSPSAAALKLSSENAGAPLRVIANIVAKGHYLGGGRFETGALKVPILVCSGCLDADPTAGETVPEGFGYYCKTGESVVAVCPNAGQIGTPVCEAATP